jgi:hypothetical protein
MKRNKVKSTVQAGKLSVLRREVAGADLGSREHYVCAPTLQGDGRDVESIGSITAELYRMADWLKARGVKSVTMESTGVYWISVYEVLESRGFDVVLVNARALLSVPGRKTDVLDCQWIQLLHSCGLLKGSFRPADDVCALRALIQERSTLIAESADWIRRMQKSVDQMNIRAHQAVADLSGVTDMAIVRAIVGGERDPKVLAGPRDVPEQRLEGRGRLAAALALRKRAPACRPRSAGPDPPQYRLNISAVHAPDRSHRRKLRHLAKHTAPIVCAAPFSPSLLVAVLLSRPTRRWLGIFCTLAPLPLLLSSVPNPGNIFPEKFSKLARGVYEPKKTNLYRSLRRDGDGGFRSRPIVQVWKHGGVWHL